MGVLLFFGLLFFSPPHGDLSLRIEVLSAEIQQFPDSLNLYLLRGELFIQHDQPREACRDFSFCLSRGKMEPRVFEGMSKSFLQPGKADSALLYINLALERDPISFSALEWKARILYLMQRYCEAGQCYEKIIDQAPASSPGLFIDAAQCWDHCTNNDGGSIKAISILRLGVQRLGPLHVLEKEMVKLYLSHHDFENAIEIQSRLIGHSINPAWLLWERAEIYIVAGQHNLAFDDLTQALTVLQSLPAYKENLPAYEQLSSGIRDLLKKLKG